MKTVIMMLCMSLLLPIFAQESQAPAAPQPCTTCIKEGKAPTPEQHKAFRKQMKERFQKHMTEIKAACVCSEEICPCFKVMSERPQFARPTKKPSEMTDAEREAFRKQMKEQMEAFRQKVEAAKATCKCGEACRCLPRPQLRGKHHRKGKGPRHPGVKNAPKHCSEHPTPTPAAE
ncbi:MAG: hypothetical protein IJV69_01970 [Kiritimatiellae bacterium]|nr:hypothetical protein [Kiritimatiellia bacterium]